MMVLRPSPYGTGPTEGREQPPKVPYIVVASPGYSHVPFHVHDFFPCWLSEHYELLASDPENDAPVAFVSIKDLYADLRASPQFQDMNKKERRLMNEGKFRAAVAKSNTFKGLYREAKQVRINGERQLKDGLVNLRKKQDEDDGQAEAGPGKASDAFRKRGREE
eukprot:579798-Prymnesium_polylepis.1